MSSPSRFKRFISRAFDSGTFAIEFRYHKSFGQRSECLVAHDIVIYYRGGAHNAGGQNLWTPLCRQEAHTILIHRPKTHIF